MSTQEKKTIVQQPVAVLGIGVEGRATIQYLQRHGIEQITALDRNQVNDLPTGIEHVFGDDHDKNLGRFATVFRSPSARPDHPSFVEARKTGTQITSAIAYFLENSPARVIGVTGTVGKGTASSLIASMLEEAGFRVHLGGNIGASPLGFLDDVKPDDLVVLEISSFQAMDVQACPNIGVALKTTSEHLDWHKDLHEYKSAKANLFANQSADDTLIVNADIDGSLEVASKSFAGKVFYSVEKRVREGLFLRDDVFVLVRNGAEKILPLDITQLKIPGKFNLENVAASIIASLSAGASMEAVCSAAIKFKGLPHRLEFVSEIKNVRFYNDTYATRPEATLGAMSCFKDEPLALILGGSEKHADFGELARAVLNHPTLTHVALIGATADRLFEIIDATGTRRFSMEKYQNLEPAMEGAAKSLERGVVLLSPACASFGLFPNYKVRGQRFRDKVSQMATS